MCCAHTHSYVCSPKNYPLVIPGSVFFPAVYTDGINHDIDLSWSKLLQIISERLLFENPFQIILYR